MLFAVDGLVVEGESYADEQLISGEPIPVAKTAGAQVYAGTLNGSGSLTYRASEVGRATVLARIIRLVQEAQSSRAPIQRLVDRIARIFVPRDRPHRAPYLGSVVPPRPRGWSDAGTRGRRHRTDHRLPLCSRPRHPDSSYGGYRTGS